MPIKEIDDLEEKEKKFINSADMNKLKKNRGGRPKKEVAEKASEQIFINVTKLEKKAAEDKAAELGISLSSLAKIGLKKMMEF